jgi:flagellar P-ring protein precursor FlgI
MPRLAPARPLAVAAALSLLVDLGASAQPVTRLKDVTSLQGAAPMPLLGYGLVVGLNKTGDRRQTIFSAQSLASMLQRFGVVVPADQIKIENVAAVLVTADLPPYSRPGTRLDVTASSIGDARSLQGGTLLATPLRGGNGEVYALAQGALTLGGFGGGTGGNSVQVNHLTVGRVPSGGVVQIGGGASLGPAEAVTLAVREPDFATAARVAEAINKSLGEAGARAMDASNVVVRVPEAYRTAVSDFMAKIEQLPVETDVEARVVINERTGTVVVGGHVRLGPAAVAHGNLSVRISTRFEVSQPAPFSRNGDTAVVPNEQVDVQEGTARLVALEEGTSLDAVVRALNVLGASPRDVIAIVQALSTAGALMAKIVVM